MANSVRRAIVRVAANTAGAGAVLRTTPVRCKGASKVVWVLRATNANSPQVSAMFASNDRATGAVTGNFVAATAAATGCLKGSATGVGALNAGGLCCELLPETAASAVGGLPVEQAELRVTDHATLAINGLEIEAFVFDGNTADTQDTTILK